MLRYYLTLFYILCNVHHNINSITAFNVEPIHYAVYRGDMRSMFGFSVAEYRDKNHRGWVIIGAPLNQSNQIGIEKGGAVYRCDISDDNRCFAINFDKKGIDYVKSYRNANGVEPIDDKSYQLFGATLSTSMIDGGPLLVCSPKYHWFGYIKANWSVAGFKDAVGSCWLTSLHNSSSTEYSPCRNNDTAGHHRQGMCQAGFGAAITKDGKRLFIGAPGSWYWQGQLFTIESNITLPFVPVKDTRSTILKDGQIPTHQLNLVATKEGPANEDNSYLGYSVVVGDFLDNGDSGVAVAVPRSAELYGKVLMYTSQLFNHQNITGEQMGAYFGYALAVNDIDGDGRDDLIVSAPFYTISELSGAKIETGRIYVFYQGRELLKYQRFDTRDGAHNRGQFGISIASLGDIDLDGYGDLIIGEPYGGLESRGAVYIFRGSKNGIEENPSQVLYSENLEQPVRTFGWSVTGGLDLDGNHYPDIVIGAYQSDTAIFFRSRPVINIFSEINFTEKYVSLNNKTCILSDGSGVVCSELKICCMYTGQGSSIQHDFVIHITLDEKKKKNPRLFFLDFESKNTLKWPITLIKDKPYCRQIKVYVAQYLRDKLTSLDSEMYIELLTDNNVFLSESKKRDPRRNLKATLSPKNIKKRDYLQIRKNCGSDNICIPDLSISVTKNFEKYLLGSGKILELDVRVLNKAEDAYETVFYLQLPIGIDYINTEVQNKSNEIFMQCSAPTLSSNNILRCDLGNPFPEGKIVSFKIYLQPITFYGMKPAYELSMKINSTNPEKSDTVSDNNLTEILPVWIETDLLIEGESKPQVLDFNAADYSNNKPNLSIAAAKFSPILTHNYTIRNNGPSAVISIAISLIWTAETFSGDVLLYLIEQPEISKHKVRCDTANADYLDFNVPRKIRNVNKHIQAQPLTDTLKTMRDLFINLDLTNVTMAYDNYFRRDNYAKLYENFDQETRTIITLKDLRRYLQLSEEQPNEDMVEQKVFNACNFKNLKEYSQVNYKKMSIQNNNFMDKLVERLKNIFSNEMEYEICNLNDQVYIRLFLTLLIDNNKMTSYLCLWNSTNTKAHHSDMKSYCNLMSKDLQFIPTAARIVISSSGVFYCQLQNGSRCLSNQVGSKLNFLSDNLVRYKSKTKDTDTIQNSRYLRQTINHWYLKNQEDNNSSILDIVTLCKTAQCVNLQCTVGPLSKDEEVSISARYRINMHSLKKITNKENIKVSTKLLAVVTSQPFIGEPMESIKRSYEIKTLILPNKNLHNIDIVPLWIVVLSASAGTAILLSLIFLLYKCGFFKRNRPTETQDTQPLNRPRYS